MPSDPTQQCHLIWANILAALADAELTTAHIVKVTTHLGDRSLTEINTAVRTMGSRAWFGRRAVRPGSPSTRAAVRHAVGWIGS